MTAKDRVIAAARKVNSWKWEEIIPNDGVSNNALNDLEELESALAALDREQQDNSETERLRKIEAAARALAKVTRDPKSDRQDIAIATEEVWRSVDALDREQQQPAADRKMQNLSDCIDVLENAPRNVSVYSGTLLEILKAIKFDLEQQPADVCEKGNHETGSRK